MKPALPVSGWHGGVRRVMDKCADMRTAATSNLNECKYTCMGIDKAFTRGQRNETCDVRGLGRPEASGCVDVELHFDYADSELNPAAHLKPFSSLLLAPLDSYHPLIHLNALRPRSYT